MQRPLYDQLVEYYQVIEERNWRRELELIVSILKKHHSTTVLDLGCGIGYHVIELAKLGFEATGVDISRKNVRFARKMARQENVHPRFVAGSYYRYRPHESVDAALYLNWSIPTRDADINRFLSNTRSMLRMRGLVILDYERVSEIVWEDVGKPIVNSWDLERLIIVRVSLGEMLSNVLCSKDIYILYPKGKKPRIPSEQARYRGNRNVSLAKIYLDRSYVRFFSLPEIRSFATSSGFRLIANYQLPRSRYKRNYAVLERVS